MLDFDVVPLDTDTSARNAESLLLFRSLDLDLHDPFLEESQVQIQMVRSIVDRIVVHLMHVQVKFGMNRVLMHYKGVWNDEIRCDHMRVVKGICMGWLREVGEAVAEVGRFA